MTFCFIISAIIFTWQVNKYSLAQRQEKLQETASTVSDMTDILFNNYSEHIRKFYNLNMIQIAEDSQTAIVVCDRTGRILLYTDKNEIFNKKATYISFDALNTALSEGKYSGVGTLGTVFLEPSHIIGVSDYSSDILVFVASPAKATVSLTTNIMRTFLVVITVTLIGMLIMTYFIAGRLTKPLKSIASASKRFALGDFKVRVIEDNNCDEIDELAISFNNMATDLEVLEELSRSFVANVSHELKTPMTTIAGFVDGIIDGTIPEANKDKYLNVISDEVKRLSRLVTKMLETAKIGSGDMILSKTNFDFNELALRILLSFENKINEKNINIDIDFNENITVLADRDRIFQVLYNLIDNAVKFVTEDGKLKISASSEAMLYRFKIFNTADNIPENDINHIFDRFYKVDRARSKDKGGAGLGLYITKSIINKHGGTILVSNLDDGVEFSFTIPKIVNK